nr:CD1845 family protein [Desulfitobacterium sp. PCE1]
MTTAAVAFLISPYGIPKLAEWFIDRLDDLNCAIKSI